MNDEAGLIRIAPESSHGVTRSRGWLMTGKLLTCDEPDRKLTCK